MPPKISSRFGGIQRSARAAEFPEPSIETFIDRESIKALARNGTSQDIYEAIMMDSKVAPAGRGPYRDMGACAPLLGPVDSGFLAIMFCTKVRDELALADTMMSSKQEGVAIAWAVEKGEFMEEKRSQTIGILSRQLPDPARASIEALLQELDARAK